MSSEFEFIEIFQRIGADYYKENGIILGPGDDCAIFNLNTPIVTSVDSSIEDVHFPFDAPVEDIGYRAVSIALSDIAAMGCRPIAFSLSVSSPFNEIDWYMKLSKGVKDIAEEFRISLIGGDLTKGPLNINAIVYGTPYDNNILRRDTAGIGDKIYISKPVGRGSAGLNAWKSGNKNSPFVKDYLRPKPMIKLGKNISKVASACIDTSDGLLTDLKKMIHSSKLGARIYLDTIPITSNINDINKGDDYDLCFTIPKELNIDNYIYIGDVTDCNEINFISEQGYDINITGYDHFKNE